jgi:hypothetical protein
MTRKTVFCTDTTIIGLTLQHTNETLGKYCSNIKHGRGTKDLCNDGHAYTSLQSCGFSRVFDMQQIQVLCFGTFWNFLLVNIFGPWLVESEAEKPTAIEG